MLDLLDLYKLMLYFTCGLVHSLHHYVPWMCTCMHLMGLFISFSGKCCLHITVYLQGLVQKVKWQKCSNSEFLTFDLFLYEGCLTGWLILFPFEINHITTFCAELFFLFLILLETCIWALTIQNFVVFFSTFLFCI